tara:strand:+ start:365 stop:538 length:174 start_codon:yes stop_codon:yes gene_type:complete
MNEEVNAVLQVYQAKVNNLLAQNIALEAKIITLTKTLESLQKSSEQDSNSVVDGGEV